MSHQVLDDSELRFSLMELDLPARTTVIDDPEVFQAMIAACRFCWVNPLITATFPFGAPVADVEDLRTVNQADLGGCDMTTAEIEAALVRKNCRAANVLELLAYAGKKWCRGETVVALGTLWTWPSTIYDPSVPFICADRDGRKFGLWWAIRHSWKGDRLFLVAPRVDGKPIS